MYLKPKSKKQIKIRENTKKEREKERIGDRKRQKIQAK